jgi:hypothetical protein
LILRVVLLRQYANIAQLPLFNSGEARARILDWWRSAPEKGREEIEGTIEDGKRSNMDWSIYGGMVCRAAGSRLDVRTT